MTSLSLAGWLARLEGLHPKGIDLGLDRVRVVADRLDLASSASTVIVGGTNGKGSTCAMLDSILRAAGYRTGLYTSPHLLEFNERACIDGVDASDEQLIESFEAVETVRGATSLTYFEFTTLAILRLFAQARLDAVVLEVGLGGRLDAVNLVDADVSIVTSVDIDHTDYLGPTRELIGLEKAHIYRPGRAAICSDPQTAAVTARSRAHASVRISGALGADFNYQGDRQQWAYGGRRVRRSGLPYPALRGANQLLNASGALAALEALGRAIARFAAGGSTRFAHGGASGPLPDPAGAVRPRSSTWHTIPHAAAVLAENLDSMGYFPVTHAVFGMLGDKDIAGVVGKLGNRIDHWHVGPTPGSRGTSAAQIGSQLRAAGVGTASGQSITEHSTLADAYAAARVSASADDRILTFGSFLTVADVMRAIRTHVRSGP